MIFLKMKIKSIIKNEIVNLYGYELMDKIGLVYAPFNDCGTEIAVDETVALGNSNTYVRYLIIVISLLLNLFCYFKVSTVKLL